MKPTYKQVTKTRYIEQISQLAEEIFVQHYTKLTIYILSGKTSD